MNESEKLQRLLIAIKPICWAFRRGKPTLNKDLKALSETQQEVEADLPFNKEVANVCACDVPKPHIGPSFGPQHCDKCGKFLSHNAEL